VKHFTAFVRLDEQPLCSNKFGCPLFQAVNIAADFSDNSPLARKAIIRHRVLVIAKAMPQPESTMRYAAVGDERRENRSSISRLVTCRSGVQLGTRPFPDRFQRRATRSTFRSVDLSHFERRM
jgi:hypothetical protein